MAVLITLTLLESKSAHPDTVKWVKTHCPDGWEVTEANVRAGMTQGPNTDHLVCLLLDRDSFDAYKLRKKDAQDLFHAQLIVISHTSETKSQSGRDLLTARKEGASEQYRRTLTFIALRALEGALE